MDGRLYQRLLSILFLAQTSVTGASEAPYEFHFEHPRFGVSVTAESIDEVYEILSLWGPEFDVLEITAERRVSETVTEFTFSAPPPNPVPGEAYFSFWNHDFKYDVAFTLDDAEALLFARYPWQWDKNQRSAKWSGTMPDFPPYSGAPYRAYVPFSLPAPPEPYDGPITRCGPAGWNGDTVLTYFWGGMMKGPNVPGLRCNRWNEEPPIYGTDFYAYRIETRDGYYCGEGYYPDWTPDSSNCYNSYVVIVERRAKCSVQPPIPLEDLIAQYHSNDAEMVQLTRDLEAGANLSLRDMLTEATQQTEACVSSRFTAGGFSYQLQSGLRPQAYQAHFYDLMDKWKRLRLLQENDPEIFEACAEVRETIEAEVGRRIGETACTAPGRNHCLDNTVAKNSRHPDGTAFDVSRANVNALMAYLAKDGPPALTVEDWVNRPNGCGVGWGGLYDRPDDVHFYLRQGEQHMDFLALIAALTAAPEPQLPPDVAHGEPVYVRVLVSGEHVDGDVIYHYTLLNQHPEEALFDVLLGAEFDDYGMVPMLSTEPVDTILHERVLPNEVGRIKETFELASYASSAPPLWEIELLSQEFSGGYYLNLRRQYGNITPGAGGIPPGQQLEGFNIRLPHADSKYYKSGFVAYINWPGQYFGYPEVLDTAAPELSVSADREELWPPNNKLVDVNVDINATDDYDGQPAIKLVSITANEPLEEGDIEGAEFGTDDRSFRVRATRDGRNREGRVYTITYEATDAMANTAHKTVEVIVPHDQRR